VGSFLCSLPDETRKADAALLNRGSQEGVAMLSPRGVCHADQRQAMLDDGVLPDDGPVELLHGTVGTLTVAVRIVLAEIDHLAYPEVAGPDVPERWDMAEADLETLWWLVVTQGRP
jgi:hypothetical protein